jgi:hypothetical protein
LVVLCSLWFAGAVWASPGEPDILGQQDYLAYREAQIQEVAFKSPAELLGSNNIFYLGADEIEWVELEAILDEYFDVLRASGYDLQRFQQLAARLELYQIRLKRGCIPVGYYSIGESRVYLEESLFQEGINPNFARSVVYHEKVHANQLKRLDRQVLRFDQKQSYRNKLEEIGAHYNQIRYILRFGDEEALGKVLANSNQQRMFPNLQKFYPHDNPVVAAIRAFLKKYAGT